jgi:hypothetical protein
VRSRLPWPWRAVLGASVLAIIAGMWWWGFDFGQIFGVVDRRETEAKIASLESEGVRLRTEASQLQASNTQLASELAMAKGAQASLTRQALELQGENSQMKEELAFLQKLVADSSRQVGVSIQRLEVEREREDAWHYRVLLVRGGNPKDEFDGHVTLQVTVQPAGAGAPTPRATTLTLPDDDPATVAALKLKFKYYQRLEGTIGTPGGGIVRAVTARAFETGQSSPRATRDLVIP